MLPVSFENLRTTVETGMGKGGVSEPHKPPNSDLAAGSYSKVSGLAASAVSELVRHIDSPQPQPSLRGRISILAGSVSSQCFAGREAPLSVIALSWDPRQRKENPLSCLPLC